MGYRSNVALAMSKQVRDDFLRRLSSENITNDTRKEVRFLFKNADRHINDPDTGAEAWYWSAMKWYPGYPDVDFIEGVMSELNEEEFYFARVGESYDDNDIQGCWWDNPFGIRFCRKIVFDY